MIPSYAPQRKSLLALHHEKSNPEMDLAVRDQPEGGNDAQRQMALSVPEAVRALGEPLEPFAAACGGRQTLSLSVRRSDGRLAPETCVFQQPFVLVGRCPESDLALRDGAVSFRHIYLQQVAGRWLFVNLPGVSGQAAEKGKSTSGWFDIDCELTAGPYTITHVAVDPQTSTGLMLRPAPEPVHELPSFELVLVNGRKSSRERRIPRISTSITLIGSSRQCDVWLKDDSVSRVHASLVLTPQGLWVVDLLGRDGVLVDGRPAYWKQVHQGSVVQIGRFRLRVEFSASRDRALTRLDERSASDDLPIRARDSVPGGSMSEGAVLSLVKNLTEMQSQFFEHSQLQMQLMTQMLAHLGRTQQASVRQDLARIDEIGRELQAIKAQLERPAGAAPASRAEIGRNEKYQDETKGPGLLERLLLESAEAAGAGNQAANTAMAVPERPTTNFEAASGFESVPAESPASTMPTADSVGGVVQSRSRNSALDRPPGTQPPPAVADTHAWLSQRMATLSQERNSRWRRILNAFAGKSASRSAD